MNLVNNFNYYLGISYLRREEGKLARKKDDNSVSFIPFYLKCSKSKLYKLVSSLDWKKMPRPGFHITWSALELDIFCVLVHSNCFAKALKRVSVLIVCLYLCLSMSRDFEALDWLGLSVSTKRERWGCEEGRAKCKKCNLLVLMKYEIESN